ncbi:hypothetical protein HUU53_03420, partial [Candidatus Micrarchaeota archaeon]|nr:hypothetical protein [Candidatus Micrarchaeota archaeon]
MEFFLKRELKASELADLTKKASSALKQVIEKTPEGLRINLRHPSVVGFGENQAVVRIGAKTIDGVKTHFVAKLRLDVLNPGLVISKGSLTHTLMHQQNSRVVEEFGLPVVRHYASNEVFPGLHVTIVPDLTQGGKYQVFEGEGFYYPSLFGKRDFNSEHSKVLASMEKMREADILVPYNHVKKGDEALAFRKSI